MLVKHTNNKFNYLLKKESQLTYTNQLLIHNKNSINHHFKFQILNSPNLEKYNS